MHLPSPRHARIGIPGVLGRVAMGTLVSVILEVLSTEGLATSITFERKHVLQMMKHHEILQRQ